MSNEKVIAFDTETVYGGGYTLKKMSVYEYVRDDRFKCYMVSAADETGAVACEPKDFDWERLNGAWVLAHNAMFDRLVFERMQQQGIVPAHIQPKRWICTADMTAYFRVARSLGNAARVFLGQDLSKDVRDQMRGKTLADVQGTQLGIDLLEYAKRDAQACYDIWQKKNAEWPMVEQMVSEASRDAGIRGLRIDTDLLESSLESLSKQLHDAEVNIPWDWDPKKHKTPLQVSKIREQCRKEGIWAPASFAEDDAECDKWEAEFADKYAWIGALRNWRKINIIYKKLMTIKNNLVADRFSYALKYFGAATGRWSGSEKFNVQNMYKDPIFGVDLRSHIIADEGDIMVVVDWSQIEARALLWMVGDNETLEELRRGKGIYQVHAEKYMGVDPAIDLKNAKTQEHKDLYNLAKARVLSLGYGCGFEKFISMAAAYGLQLTPEKSKEIVEDFRSGNPRIPAFWSKRQQKLRYAVERGLPVYEVTLPSGRKLTYHKPIYSKSAGYQAYFMDGDSNRRKLYGGLLTENIIQAMCRDILAEKWVQFRAEGFKVLFTCHDEFIFSIPKGPDLKAKLKRIKEIMCEVPKWVEGLPLGCSMVVTPKYVK